MEEARIPEFIINNGEQTYPETVESQKIETREEENVSCCSLDIGEQDGFYPIKQYSIFVLA